MSKREREGEGEREKKDRRIVVHTCNSSNFLHTRYCHSHLLTSETTIKARAHSVTHPPLVYIIKNNIKSYTVSLQRRANGCGI